MPFAGFLFGRNTKSAAERRIERELLARKIPPKAARLIAAKRAKGCKR
jgi:hypothetical protein